MLILSGNHRANHVFHKRFGMRHIPTHPLNKIPTKTQPLQLPTSRDNLQMAAAFSSDRYWLVYFEALKKIFGKKISSTSVAPPLSALIVLRALVHPLKMFLVVYLPFSQVQKTIPSFYFFQKLVIRVSPFPVLQSISRRFIIN